MCDTDTYLCLPIAAFELSQQNLFFFKPLRKLQHKKKFASGCGKKIIYFFAAGSGFPIDVHWDFLHYYTMILQHSKIIRTRKMGSRIGFEMELLFQNGLVVQNVPDKQCRIKIPISLFLVNLLSLNVLCLVIAAGCIVVIQQWGGWRNGHHPGQWGEEERDGEEHNGGVHRVHCAAGEGGSGEGTLQLTRCRAQAWGSSPRKVTFFNGLQTMFFSVIK